MVKYKRLVFGFYLGALLALHLDVQYERQSRPAQTRVPAIKGLRYENAETKLHPSDLNIRLLATRYDLPLEPGLSSRITRTWLNSTRAFFPWVRGIIQSLSC